MAAESAPAATPALTGMRLGLATFAVALASFMNVLDTTIAVVALPTIAGNLSATPSQASWVITSYGVCLAVVLPLSGWLSKRYGEVTTFCTAMLLFTLTSWLCASATGFNQLLLFRGLQGAAGGLLIPLSQSLLMRMYPPERHGFALGIWALTSAVAPVMGPLLGGYITDYMGWPWIFYVNVPLGMLTTWVVWQLLRSHETPRQREPIDAVGLLLLVTGVICCQLVLDRGHELDWLESTSIRVMLGVAAACLVLFLVWERDEAHPVVDLSLFRYPSFVIGSALISLFYAAFVVSAVMYPLWLQTVLGYTATWSGVVLAPTSLVPLLLLPIIGQRLALWDPRPLITVGTIVVALSLLLHARGGTDSSAQDIALSRLLIGFGMPFAWMPMMMASLVGLPPEKIATATGLFNFMRMLASSMGTALAVTLWEQRSVLHRSQMVDMLSRDTPEIQGSMELLGARGGDALAPLQMLELLATAQARTLGIQDVFLACAVAVLLVGCGAWLLPRARKSSPVAVPLHD